MSQSYIYFLRPKGQDGPVKIGFSIYPESRLITYMAWSPVPLEVAAVFPVQNEGTKRQAALLVERQFHTRYSRFRLHHEWFLANPRLLKDIELIRNRRFRLAWLPAPEPVIWAAKMKETKRAQREARALRSAVA